MKTPAAPGAGKRVLSQGLPPTPVLSSAPGAKTATEAPGAGKRALSQGLPPTLVPSSAPAPGAKTATEAPGKFRSAAEAGASEAKAKAAELRIAVAAAPVQKAAASFLTPYDAINLSKSSKYLKWANQIMLDLSNRDLNSEKLISLIDKHPNIKHLNLSNLELNDKVFTKLGSLSYLETVNLSGCHQITDEGVSELVNLENLHTINLRGTKVTDQGVSALAGCIRLHTINLRSTNVTDQGVSALAGCASLYTINLSCCRNLTDVSALEGCANLHTLNLSWCHGVSDVSALGGCASLHTLNLTGCIRVTNVGALAGSKSLHTINLRSTNVTDQGVSALAGCASLHTFHLGHTYVTNVGALARCKSLHTLDLSFCINLTDVSALGDCASLHTLNLTGCILVTNVGALARCESLYQVIGYRGFENDFYNLIDFWVRTGIPPFIKKLLKTVNNSHSHLKNPDEAWKVLGCLDKIFKDSCDIKYKIIILERDHGWQNNFQNVHEGRDITLRREELQPLVNQFCQNGVSSFIYQLTKRINEGRLENPDEAWQRLAELNELSQLDDERSLWDALG